MYKRQGGTGTQGSLEGGNTNGGTDNGGNGTNNGQNNTTTAVGKISLDAVDKKLLVGKTVTLTAEIYPCLLYTSVSKQNPSWTKL